jgi:hypothetical protein
MLFPRQVCRRPWTGHEDACVGVVAMGEGVLRDMPAIRLDVAET